MDLKEVLEQLGEEGSTLSKDIDISTQAFEMVKEICSMMIATRSVKMAIFFIASLENMITSTLDNQFSGFSELVESARECIQMSSSEKESRLAKLIADSKGNDE